MALEFDVVIIEDETGGYIASVPSLPGCHTQAETLDALMKNVQEAIQLYLETLDDDEKNVLLRKKVSGIQRVSISG
jgi:predicted RNase H-like HicB family nuclease